MTDLTLRCSSPFRNGERGASIVEVIIVLVVIAIMTAISFPYILNYKKLYKSEDQAIKVMDLMREAAQLAMTRRRSFRFEVDLTDNAVLIIDEDGANPDKLYRLIPMEPTGQVRMDVIPSGVTKPNPPNYNNAAFAADGVGHKRGANTVTGHTVWAVRFNSDGSATNQAGVPVSANLFIWPPVTAGSTTPRTKQEVRAITLFGASGAIRYWKHNGSTFVAYQ
jgi:type II secretory pathway pseudopilin PulG